VQVINSLVSGILSIVLPLMMEKRNISIITIGFVFASMPMVFQFGRMIFATVSDFWGRKPFFIMNGCLGAITNSMYYFAHTPIEFLYGKVLEGVKSGSLWAVNRAFLMEKSNRKWKALVDLRTVAYVSSAIGSLSAGFLVVLFLYEGTLMLCALFSALVVPFSLLLFGSKRKTLSIPKALRVLDLRNKKRIFKVYLVLFFVMGISFGYVSGFVFPLFLSYNGFETETIGVLLGLQIMLAGLTSYLLARRFEMSKLIITSGVLYTLTLFMIGISSAIIAGVLVVIYGIVEGLLSIGQEGILSKITDQESYGTDIGPLWTSHHCGRTLSIAISGLLISILGFTAPFLISAFVFMLFYVPSFLILKGLKPHSSHYS